MEEKWLPIKGYEKYYMISNLGRVKSLRTGKILKKRLTFDGYVKVTLTINYESKDFRVHRLVAEHFIPNPEGKETVNHIDGNKENNSVDNLEWATRSEQLYHAYKLGTKKSQKGCSNVNSKLTEDDVREIRKSYKKGIKGYGYQALANKYGVDKTTIANIVNYRTYKNVQ